MMSVLRPKHHVHKPDGTLPLINIVLLLVLAFMMAGTFTEPFPTDFDPLRSDEAQHLTDEATPVILTMDTDGAITVDGSLLASDALESFLADFPSRDQALELRADARTPSVLVIKFLSRAERAGLRNVKIVTLGRR